MTASTSSCRGTHKRGNPVHAYLAVIQEQVIGHAEGAVARYGNQADANGREQDRAHAAAAHMARISRHYFVLRIGFHSCCAFCFEALV